MPDFMLKKGKKGVAVDMLFFFYRRKLRTFIKLKFKIKSTSGLKDDPEHT